MHPNPSMVSFSLFLLKVFVGCRDFNGWCGHLFANCNNGNEVFDVVAIRLPSFF